MESWGRMYEARSEFRRRHPTIFSVPVINILKSRLAARSRPGIGVIDLGAGDGRFKQEFQRIDASIRYAAYDPDPARAHDFSRLEDITGAYDLAVAIEVVEHLSYDDNMRLFEKTRDVLNPGGVLMITTPNVYHATRPLTDVTHKTFFAYDQLAGILSMLGFSRVDAYRVFNQPVLRRAAAWLAAPFARAFEIDFANTILIEAEK